MWLDLVKMRGVKVETDAEGKLLVVQGGARFDDVFRYTYHNKLHIVAGGMPQVRRLTMR